MAELIGDILGMIFGGLFGRPRRGEPEARPTLAYCPRFTVKKPRGRVVGTTVVFMIFESILCVIVAFFDRAMDILPVFLIACAAMCLVYAVVNLLWRIQVTEESLVTRRMLGRDTMLWYNLALVRVIRTVNVRTLEIVLRDKEGFDVLCVDTAYTNAWYLVRMAEEKGIEIREEMQSTR